MLKNPSRRNFLKTTGAVAATALVDAPRVFSAHNAASALEKRWFKGNLHMHNQWSDGKPLPEWAIDWYRTHGYDFICPSGHNIFQTFGLGLSRWPRISSPTGNLTPLHGPSRVTHNISHLLYIRTVPIRRL